MGFKIALPTINISSRGKVRMVSNHLNAANSITYLFVWHSSRIRATPYALKWPVIEVRRREFEYTGIPRI